MVRILPVIKLAGEMIPDAGPVPASRVVSGTIAFSGSV
jgi:hypothetical protein